MIEPTTILLNTTQACNDTNIWIEILKTSPAWIALFISLVVPFLTKKLDIEKANKLFMFQEKYKIYSEHFTQLYLFNNTLKSLLSLMMHFTLNENEEIDKQEFCAELNKKIEDFYKEWAKIKDKEAKIWLVADFETLTKKTDLMNTVANFSKALNMLEVSGVFSIDKSTVNNLIALGENIQSPISEYLKKYREYILEESIS